MGRPRLGTPERRALCHTGTGCLVSLVLYLVGALACKDHHLLAAVLGLAAFAAFMWGISAALAALDRWDELSKRYRTRAQVKARAYLGLVGGTDTYRCYRGSATSEGLFIRPVIGNRIARPPLLIPWEDIDIEDCEGDVILKISTLSPPVRIRSDGPRGDPEWKRILEILEQKRKEHLTAVGRSGRPSGLVGRQG